MHALINMLMASRLLYGMAKHRVLPPVLAAVQPTRRTPWVAILFTTLISFGLIWYVSYASADATRILGGTTALLLLGVFAIVNVAVLRLRRDPVRHEHFTAPSWLPIFGVITTAYLVTPLWGRDAAQYVVGRPPARLLVERAVEHAIASWAAVTAVPGNVAPLQQAGRVVAALRY